MSIPLSIVSGYLGSGKTSVILSAMAEPSAERIGLLVNDVGELSFDATFLQERGSMMVSLPNGCVCCDASAGMWPALRMLLDAGVSRIIVEASGVADPAALRSWGRSPGLQPYGVVTCVDVTTIGAKLADRWIGDTVARQIRGADAVLLTHTDISPLQQRTSAADVISALVPGAKVVEPGPGYGLWDILDSVASGAAPNPKPLDHRVFTLRTHAALNEEDLRMACAELPIAAQRMKGFVRFGAEGDPVALQWAGRRTELTPAPASALRELPGGLTGVVNLIASPDLSQIPDSLVRLGMT